MVLDRARKEMFTDLNGIKLGDDGNPAYIYKEDSDSAVIFDTAISCPSISVEAGITLDTVQVGATATKATLSKPAAIDPLITDTAFQAPSVIIGATSTRSTLSKTLAGDPLTCDTMFQALSVKIGADTGKATLTKTLTADPLTCDAVFQALSIKIGADTSKATLSRATNADPLTCDVRFQAVTLIVGADTVKTTILKSASADALSFSTPIKLTNTQEMDSLMYFEDTSVGKTVKSLFETVALDSGDKAAGKAVCTADVTGAGGAAVGGVLVKINGLEYWLALYTK